jgi:hypothetical protein
MKLCVEISEATARDIIESLTKQLRRPELTTDEEKANRLSLLRMPPTSLVLTHDQKGLVTRARNILERAESGERYNEKVYGRIRTLEAFCRLDRYNYRRLAGLNGKATKVIREALAKHGLRLWMSQKQMEEYKEGVFSG